MRRRHTPRTTVSSARSSVRSTRPTVIASKTAQVAPWGCQRVFSDYFGIIKEPIAVSTVRVGRGRALTQWVGLTDIHRENSARKHTREVVLLG